MTHFDERSKDWDTDPAKIERALVMAEAIRTSVPLTPESTALDYGCGTGLVSFPLQSAVGSITLADTSVGMLEVLAKKIKAAGVHNMHPTRLDLSADPLPTARFDLIYSLMTLHHIPDVKTLFNKFYALLKPDGYLICSDLDTEDGSFHGLENTEVHKGLDRGELQKWTSEIGFENIQFTTLYEIKKQVGENEKVFPLFLMSAKRP